MRTRFRLYIFFKSYDIAVKCGNLGTAERIKRKERRIFKRNHSFRHDFRIFFALKFYKCTVPGKAFFKTHKALCINGIFRLQFEFILMNAVKRLVIQFISHDRGNLPFRIVISAKKRRRKIIETRVENFGIVRSFDIKIRLALKRSVFAEFKRGVAYKHGFIAARYFRGKTAFFLLSRLSVQNDERISSRNCKIRYIYNLILYIEYIRSFGESRRKLPVYISFCIVRRKKCKERFFSVCGKFTSCNIPFSAFRSFGMYPRNFL